MNINIQWLMGKCNKRRQVEGFKFISYSKGKWGQENFANTTNFFNHKGNMINEYIKLKVEVNTSIEVRAGTKWQAEFSQEPCHLQDTNSHTVTVAWE